MLLAVLTVAGAVLRGAVRQQPSHTVDALDRIDEKRIAAALHERLMETHTALMQLLGFDFSAGRDTIFYTRFHDNRLYAVALSGSTSRATSRRIALNPHCASENRAPIAERAEILRGIKTERACGAERPDRFSLGRPTHRHVAAAFLLHDGIVVERQRALSMHVAQGTIAVAKALANGLGARIKGALEKTIERAPQHADAHLALATFHAEVIDKVGRMIGRITYGATAEAGLALYQRAHSLNPDSAITLTEHARGLLMLEGRRQLGTATQLQERAATIEPLDAMEQLYMATALN